VRKIFLAGAIALAFTGVQAFAAEEINDGSIAESATDENYPTATLETAGPPCQLPVTKVYRIQPGFCPQTLVYMIPKAIGSGCSGCDCGPYGIPPIYASGQNVLVRQTPEMQERITAFLTELGALVPKKAR
jgi:hypothetical protein